MHEGDDVVEVENIQTQKKMKEHDGSERLLTAIERLPFQTRGGTIISHAQPMWPSSKPSVSSGECPCDQCDYSYCAYMRQSSLEAHAPYSSGIQLLSSNTVAVSPYADQS